MTAEVLSSHVSSSHGYPMEYSVAPQEARIWIARGSFPSATQLALNQRRLQEAFALDGVHVAGVQHADDALLGGRPAIHDLSPLVSECRFESALWAQLTGYADSVVIGMTWVDEYEVLLTRSGELLCGPGCLRGKRLGLFGAAKPGLDIARADALQAYVDSLSLADLELDDVELVELPAVASDGRPRTNDAGAAVAALTNNDVDVCYLRGAAARTAQRVHRLEMVFDVSASKCRNVRFGTGTPHVITVDRALLQARPEWAVRYLGVLLHTAQWAERHRREAQRLLAESLRMSPRSFARVFGQRLRRSLEVDLSGYQRRACAARQDFLHRWGFVTSKLDLDDWIDAEPLSMAKKTEGGETMYRGIGVADTVPPVAAAAA